MTISHPCQLYFYQHTLQVTFATVQSFQGSAVLDRRKISFHFIRYYDSSDQLLKLSFLILQFCPSINAK